MVSTCERKVECACKSWHWHWSTVNTDNGFPWNLYGEALKNRLTWWRHQMETFSALLAICAGNSPVTGEFPHKGQWRGALVFPLICAWINDWVNNGVAGDLRRHRAHYDITVMNSSLQASLKEITICLYSENARVCAKWQWNARDCVTGLHDRRSRECNPVTPVECVSLSFRTQPCVLAFITYILCTHGIAMALV